MVSRIRFWVFTTLSSALPLIALGLLAVQSAHATTNNPGTGTAANPATPTPDGGIVWCVGSPSAPYTNNTFPFDTAPDGLGANPSNEPDTWQKNPILLNGVLGLDAETVALASPALADDRYAIQLNYWNSVVTGQADLQFEGGNTTAGALGYSTGNSCELFYYNTGNIGQFTITYPAPPSAANANETVLSPTGAVPNPTLYNAFPLNGNAPYSLGGADGGPTGYISTWKGCSWDASSCTAGSAVLTAASPKPPIPPAGDYNQFPQLLSTITSIPTTWAITSDPNYGTPFVNDGTHIFDASYDIWFDTTGQTGTGVAPYGNARGQNDGLEIMVWMDSNSSYVDNTVTTGGVTKYAQPNATGFAQPSGWPREQVIINNILYDVWTSRLNNPNFAHVGGTIIANGAEPYTCKLLPLWNANTGAAATTATNQTNSPGTTCGTEWNVVSFVATKDPTTGYDYRRQSMSMDTKVFTDYILGIQDGLWTPNPTNPWPADAANTTVVGSDNVLACPSSAMLNQQAPLVVGSNPACLSEAWYLTSVQAGFEPWEGGNGLESQSFEAHVNTEPTAVQNGILSMNNLPTVNWQEPFQVVYAGCASNASPNTASFTISGVYYGTTTPMYYPASDVPIVMTAVPGTNLFEGQVNAAGAAQLYPMHGNATINFTSSCGNYSAQIYIDPSGQVFYSDGKTPAVGATVTLLYSPSNSATGPFEAVPNHNFGLVNAIMAPDDNTLNPMPSSRFGTYGWDVAPGYYEVNAALANCGSVTSPVQNVVSTPITNLYLNLPCAPPPPLVAAPNVPAPPKTVAATVVSSSQINLSWSAVTPPAGVASVTYTVYEISPSITVIASGLTATTYSVIGLKPSTSYAFSVAAVDAAGASEQSPLASVTTQAAPSGNCHVTYTVTSAKPGIAAGLTVNISIQNTGKTAIYPWTLGWTFPGNQQITYVWNVKETQTGKAVTMASTAAWESIAAGATLTNQIGFNGNFTGTNTNPTAFTLNGLACQ